LFAVALVGAALSSPRGVLMLDVYQIPLGVDFKYDFVAATWIARGQPLSGLDRDTADALGSSLGTFGGPRLSGTPAHTHPPPATALVRPMLPLGFRTATLVFFGISLAAVFLMAQVLLGVWRRAPSLPSPRDAAPLALALAVWPPNLFNFGYGQWSILAAALVAASWWNLERHRGRSSAAWLAAAISIKTTPVLLAGYLVLRARRVAIGLAVALLAIAVITFPVVGGVDAWRTYAAVGPRSVSAFESLVDNTASIHGIFVRLFVPNFQTVSVFDRPVLGHVLSRVTSAALLATATLLTIRRRRISVDEADPSVFAMWASLIPLVNPLSWTHNLVFHLLPAVLLARDGNPPRRRAIVAVVIVLLTIPRQTLFASTVPVTLPFSAPHAALLGLHACAGLVLFFTACVATARAPATQTTETSGERP
jgi:hypothetical protein